MLHAPRYLAGTKIKIEQDYRAKVGEISRLIPYLKHSRPQRNAAYLCKDKFGDMEFLQESYQIQNDKTFDNPLTEDHVTHHQSPQRQISEVNRTERKCS
jgi:hypothetical protein